MEKQFFSHTVRCSTRSWPISKTCGRASSSETVKVDSLLKCKKKLSTSMGLSDVPPRTFLALRPYCSAQKRCLSRSMYRLLSRWTTVLTQARTSKTRCRALPPQRDGLLEVSSVIRSSAATAISPTPGLQ